MKETNGRTTSIFWDQNVLKVYTWIVSKRDKIISKTCKLMAFSLVPEKNSWVDLLEHNQQKEQSLSPG